eukprot:4227843-Lingulodinium_polyedra.AAC.1
MGKPTTGTVEVVSRAIKYLKRHPQCIQQMPKVDIMEEPAGAIGVMVMIDSDWVGDRSRRRSCSGGMVMVNSIVVTSWSNVQSNVALSSGEAELNAAVQG